MIENFQKSSENLNVLPTFCDQVNLDFKKNITEGD